MTHFLNSEDFRIYTIQKNKLVKTGRRRMNRSLFYQVETYNIMNRNEETR